jgi:transmembrane sensor
MEEIQHQNYEENIRWLTHLRAFGTISTDQEAYLTQELQQNEGAKIAFLEAMNQFNEEKTQSYITAPKYISLPAWEKINASYQARKARTQKIFYILAAASVLGIALTSYFIMTPSKTKNNPSQVMLITATGNKIILSGASTINTAGAVLQNQDSSLSFTATADESSTSINTLTVPSGLDYKIRLSDGTLVWMNSETKLDFPFKFGNRREITITGEAYLEVAPGANHPFLVHLPGGKQVQVLGTSFNVNAYESNISRISLLSGTVAVKSGNNSLMLKPGIEAVAGNDGISTNAFDESLVLSWRNGIFHIRSQRMSEVAKVMTRWYGTKVFIDNADLGNKVFSGVLNRKDSMTIFLNKAKEVVDFQYYIDDYGTTHLK